MRRTFVNAYLQALLSQKYYNICGIELGLENVGNIELIHRALYGGKNSGKDFRNHLQYCMRHLDFKPCLKNPYVWMSPEKKSDGLTYHEYIVFNTYNALVVSEHAEATLQYFGQYFDLKEESISPPKIYLRGHLWKVQLTNIVDSLVFISSQYVQATTKNV